MSGVVDFPVKPEARPYLEAFGRGDFIRDRREPDWLVGYRKASLARFAELGFPSRRSEAWRYIDLRPLEQRPMLPARSPKRASVRSSVRAGRARSPSFGCVARIDGSGDSRTAGTPSFASRNAAARSRATIFLPQRRIFRRWLRARYRPRRRYGTAVRDPSPRLGRHGRLAAHSQRRCRR